MVTTPPQPAPPASSRSPSSSASMSPVAYRTTNCHLDTVGRARRRDCVEETRDAGDQHAETGLVDRGPSAVVPSTISSRSSRSGSDDMPSSKSMSFMGRADGPSPFFAVIDGTRGMFSSADRLSSSSDSPYARRSAKIRQRRCAVASASKVAEGYRPHGTMSVVKVAAHLRS